MSEEELQIYKNFLHDELKWSTDFPNVKGASFEDAKKYRKRNRIIWVCDNENHKLPYWNPIYLKEQQLFEEFPIIYEEELTDLEQEFEQEINEQFS